MDNFAPPPSDRPEETRETPPGGYRPAGPVNPSASPYGYPPSGEPYYPQANPPAPGYGAPAPYEQPGYPPQYGQPGPPSQYGQQGYPPQYGQPGPPSQYGQFGAPAPMSGQYPGYGQQPPMWPGAPMPPGGGGPGQRRPVWPWIVGGVGALLIVCCVLGIIGVGALRSSPFASQVKASLTATAAATSAPTSTLVPTATTKPGVGDHMFLGHNYTRDAAGNFQIVSPTSAFKSSDEFAFVIQLSSPIGTTHATLALVKVESGGAESVQETAPMQISNPNFDEFANKLSTSQLMAGLAPGLYKLEIKTATATVASAEFTFEG